MQLAELLQLLQRQIVARQVQQRIEKHGAVAVRQHEPVAVRPGRIGWIMPQMAAPQNLGNVRHAHRRAGVARLRLLHGVNRQEPQRIRQPPWRRRWLPCGHIHDHFPSRIKVALMHRRCDRSR
jgi:hypothetical protein